MTDQPLELEIRAWLRAEVPASEVAPAALRASVAAIPRTVAPPIAVVSRRRISLIAIAAVLAGTVAGVMLLGSGDQKETPSPSAPAQTTEPATPRAPAWTAAGPLLEARSGDIIGITTWATLLADGRVLAAGGLPDTNMPTVKALASAEVYDPVARTWTATGAMADGRSGHTLTLLRDGRVLVAGGVVDYNSPTTATAELYDPSTGAWTETASMRDARAYHTATLLPDGTVLVAGGSRFSRCGPQGCSQVDIVESAEIYEPASGRWTSTSPMPAPRQNQAATLLDDGTVLIEGGGRLIGLPSAQIFDPTTAAWRETGEMVAGRNSQAAVLLTDGTVFVVGGQVLVHQDDPQFAAEIFDPARSSWTATSASPVEIGVATATLLPNGQVLVVGPTGVLLYDHSTDTWRVALRIPERAGQMELALRDGTVLIVGGNDRATSVFDSTVIYDPLAP